MTDETLKPEWEQIEESTRRLKIDNGYLYSYRSLAWNTLAICYVPDVFNEIKPDRKQESSVLVYEKGQEGLANKVAELSMKLNKMQSDLREFEKQRVDPLKNRLTESTGESERKFEELSKIVFSVIDGLRNKMDIQEKYISDCDKQRFDADEELRKRIENLENIGRQPSPWAMDSDLCNLHKRIEALETLCAKKPELSFSPQGVNLYFDAITGELKERIEKLETGEWTSNVLNNLAAQYCNLTNEVKELTKHKNYQIDENRKISVKVDELEKYCFQQQNKEYLKTPPCDHDWDTSFILTSNPPKVRCKRCSECKVIGDYPTMTFTHG